MHQKIGLRNEVTFSWDKWLVLWVLPFLLNIWGGYTRRSPSQAITVGNLASVTQ
jgi:hypothetical protein